MARRSIILFELLMRLPWWAGLVAAAIAYTIFTYVVPAFDSDRPLLIGMKAVASLLAWLFAVLCVAASMLSLARFLHARRLLAAQRGLESIRVLSWQQFEALIREFWRRRGYSVMETDAGGADGGVDLVLQRDGKRYLVQCRQWRAASVAVGPVHELFDVMKAEDASGAYLVTSGHFTAEAVAFAQGKPLELIDGHALAEMIAEVGSTTAPVSKVRPMRSETAPTCPACGAFMVRRISSGASAGRTYWGCAAFPKCRGMRAA